MGLYGAEGHAQANKPTPWTAVYAVVLSLWHTEKN